MMEVPQITDFDEVIEPHLPNLKLVSYTSKYLTKPGDNYGSVLLLINATLKDTQGELSEKSFIAKLPPVTNDIFWEIFQPERTCISENGVYKILAPEVEKLQSEAGVPEEQIFDGIPRYYGSRISLDPQATKVDRDAVLVMENLQASGYKPGNRLKPYDWAHTLLVLKYMAKYHALPIALRLKKPTIYNHIVRPCFTKFNFNGPAKAMKEGVLALIKTVTNNNEKDVARVAELIELRQQQQAASDVEDGLYNSIVHFDLWINNIMIKYANDGTPERVKFVDFQIAQYDSFIHDLIFFLFANVETKVVDERYEELLKFYYSAFIDCLQSVKVDTSVYTYQSFTKEIKRVAHIQIPHALSMATVLFADNSNLPEDFKDFDSSKLGEMKGNESIYTKQRDIIRLAKKYEIFY